MIYLIQCYKAFWKDVAISRRMGRTIANLKMQSILRRKNGKTMSSSHDRKEPVSKSWRLKRDLVLQSFCPLFFLLLIKYFDAALFVGLRKFLVGMIEGDFKVWGKAVYALFCTETPKIYSLLIMLICISWGIGGIVVYVFFGKLQESGLNDFGEKIQVDSFDQDVGITFFVTYILPLMMDDINTGRGFLIFLVLMCMMIKLLMSSNLYYQNPVLALMGYRIFHFTFVETSDKDKKGKTFIGMTGRHGEVDSHKPFTMKQRSLSDGVYLIFHKIRTEDRAVTNEIDSIEDNRKGETDGD
ncbi:MAG: hypothetical protein HFH84_19730 [Lachnospiraceae bacterium]|nr:hypothetical protein [Lachnospiraceae bacterium]